MTDFSSLQHYDLVFLLESLQDKEFVKMCSTDKKMFDICYNSKDSERIFNTRSEKFIDKDIIELKDPKMKWKEFYIRIRKLENEQLSVNEYCKNGGLLEVKIYVYILNTYPDLNGYNLAIENGHLEIVKFIHSFDPKIDEYDDLYISIKYNQLEIFKYLLSIGIKIQQIRERDDIGDIISYERIEMIKHLISIGFSAKDFEYYVENMIRGNKFETLKYLISVGLDIKCLEKNISVALSQNRLDVLKFLHSVGFKFTMEHINIIIPREKREMLNYMFSIMKQQ